LELQPQEVHHGDRSVSAAGDLSAAKQLVEPARDRRNGLVRRRQAIAIPPREAVPSGRRGEGRPSRLVVPPNLREQDADAPDVGT
jgi:hypothetical protein